MITFEQASSRFFYFSDTGQVFDIHTGVAAGRIEVNHRTSYQKISAFGKTLRATERMISSTLCLPVRARTRSLF